MFLRTDYKCVHPSFSHPRKGYPEFPGLSGWELHFLHNNDIVNYYDLPEGSQMSKVGKIKKLSNTPYLNFYEFEAVYRSGNTAPYYVASRAKKTEDLKAVHHENRADGVILYGIYGENKDRVVLIRQFRYPLGPLQEMEGIHTADALSRLIFSNVGE